MMSFVKTICETINMFGKQDNCDVVIQSLASRERKKTNTQASEHFPFLTFEISWS